VITRSLDIDVDSFAIGTLGPETHRSGVGSILYVAGWIGPRSARFSFDLPTRGGTEKDERVTAAVEALLRELSRVARERLSS
jgi:hypothetical protein